MGRGLGVAAARWAKCAGCPLLSRHLYCTPCAPTEQLCGNEFSSTRFALARFAMWDEFFYNGIS
jgi:hypothetical protein